MNGRMKDWLKLLAGLALAALLVVMLNIASAHAPGTAGGVYKNIIERDIEASALFYTEVDDVAQFLDEENGRYASP